MYAYDEDEKDFFGLGDDDDMHFPLGVLSDLDEEPRYMHTPITCGTWVDSQLPETWYQFGKGPLVLRLRTTDHTIVANGWFGLSLRLMYADGRTPVVARTPTTLIREVLREVQGDTITLELRINAVSSTFQHQAFALECTLGTVQFCTTAFSVMTKKTKPRTGQLSYPAYRALARNVCLQLQWQPSGTGEVNAAGHTVLVCPLCQNQSDFGHLATCPMELLL